MSKKMEIKVYLPAKLVGQLEEKRKAGIRSKFIEDAIRKLLNKQSEFDIWDVSDLELYRMARVRAMESKDEVLWCILNNRLEALE